MYMIFEAIRTGVLDYPPLEPASSRSPVVVLSILPYLIARGLRTIRRVLSNISESVLIDPHSPPPDYGGLAPSRYWPWPGLVIVVVNRADYGRQLRSAYQLGRICIVYQNRQWDARWDAK